MKKAFILLLTILCVFTILAACDDPGGQLKIDLSETIKIDILHYAGGQEESWTIYDKADIANLTEWLSDLRVELKQKEDNSQAFAMKNRCRLRIYSGFLSGTVTKGCAGLRRNCGG